MRRLGNSLASFSTRWVPDAFVFAVLLTAVVFALALGLTDRSALELVGDWYGGFWNLLEFGMQMTLVLVTGYALASSPPARRAIAWVAARPRGPLSAVGVTALGAALLGTVHWGLGLIAGALLAVEVGRSCRSRGIRVHFPLLVAGGYTGLMVWHSGLSGSAPLLVNTPGHFLEEQIGLLPLSETLFQPFNLVFLTAMLVGAPLLLMAMHPRGEETEEIEEDGADGPLVGAVEAADRAAGGATARRGAGGWADALRGRLRRGPGTSPTARGGSGTGRGGSTESGTLPFAQRLAHSRILVYAVVAVGLVHLVPALVVGGVVGMDINLLNFTFLIVGLALHGSLAGYSSAAAGGARNAAAVIVQFPFYAGIMGIMAESGLLAVITEWFVSIATPFSYPFLALVSAALVNFMVPSGGGQWAVQGPVVIGATESLGLAPGVGVMAVAMGDQLTNGIQPFWALPLLALTRLSPGRILGYSAVVMLFGFVVASLCITFLS